MVPMLPAAGRKIDVIWFAFSTTPTGLEAAFSTLQYHSLLNCSSNQSPSSGRLFFHPVTIAVLICR